MEPGDARLYDELIPLIQLHAAGKFIYAAPNCPEVYFLSGLQSPSRHSYDFSEEPGLTQRTLSAIDKLNINLVVINSEPRFSGEMDTELRAALDQRFTHSAEIGQFQVRWEGIIIRPVGIAITSNRYSRHVRSTTDR